jgi:mRNA interferase MazF
VLLLSRDESYAVRDFIVLCPITTRRRGLPTEVEVGPEEGLPGPSVANLDVIITAPKGRLQERISALSPEKLAAVEAAVYFALDLQT